MWMIPGDSLLVVDRLPPRLSIFSLSGRLSRTAPGPRSEPIPLPFVAGVLENGTLVLRGARNPSGRSSPGIERDELVLALAEIDSDEPLVVGSFPGAAWEYTDVGAGAFGRRLLTFSSSTQVAAGASQVYVGFPDRYEIRRYGSDGVIEMVVRRDAPLSEVTQRDLDWLMERRLAEVSDPAGRPLVRQAFRDLPHADAMPAFGVPIWPDGAAEGGPSLLVDDVGNLWVFEHYRPGEYANRWSVFSPEGVWLGVVSLPDHLRPTQIGDDFVLGHWRDETGFVHVRRHRLVKP
jgi:hypothetical protein